MVLPSWVAFNQKKSDSKLAASKAKKIQKTLKVKQMKKPMQKIHTRTKYLHTSSITPLL